MGQIGEPHPLDFDALSPGDFIEPERIEAISETRRGTDQYRLFVLALCSQIEREMELRGTPVYARQRDSGIVIFNGLEGHQYAERQFKRGLRSIAYHHAMGTKVVDIQQLNPETRERVEREQMRRSGFLLAISSERRRLENESKAIGQIEEPKATEENSKE